MRYYYIYARKRWTLADRRCENDEEEEEEVGGIRGVETILQLNMVFPIKIKLFSFGY